jgi:hypothetical protein
LECGCRQNFRCFLRSAALLCPSNADCISALHWVFLPPTFGILPLKSAKSLQPGLSIKLEVMKLLSCKICRVTHPFWALYNKEPSLQNIIFHFPAIVSVDTNIILPIGYLAFHLENSLLVFSLPDRFYWKPQCRIWRVIVMYRHLFVLNCQKMAPWLPLESFSLKSWYSVNLDSEMRHTSGSDTYVINQKPKKEREKQEKNMKEFHKLVKALSCHF